MLSEAVKMLKVQYLVKAIDAHKVDQAIVFCRTKLDCDNVENYLVLKGGGGRGFVTFFLGGGGGLRKKERVWLIRSGLR